MKYITYITIYAGEKLPTFYIGSTSLDKHINFYHGTVKSNKYQSIYEQELIEHPELFDSCIIDEFDTREEATFCEYYYQKLYNVVRSDQFFNMAFANVNGCFGMDVSDKFNPFYKHKHSTKSLKLQSEAKMGELNPMYGLKRVEHSKRMNASNNPFYNKKHTKENLLKCGIKNVKVLYGNMNQLYTNYG